MTLGMSVAATLRVVDGAEDVEREQRVLALCEDFESLAPAGDLPRIVRLGGPPPSDEAAHLREVYPGACLIW